MSDQNLRQALLGTWRLISCQDVDTHDADGTLLKPLGDNPHGYLVYMPDGHLFVQYAARERPELFGRSVCTPTAQEAFARFWYPPAGRL
jgi:hypothetical protein